MSLADGPLHHQPGPRPAKRPPPHIQVRPGPIPTQVRASATGGFEYWPTKAPLSFLAQLNDLGSSQALKMMQDVYILLCYLVLQTLYSSPPQDISTVMNTPRGKQAHLRTPPLH